MGMYMFILYNRSRSKPSTPITLPSSIFPNYNTLTPALTVEMQVATCNGLTGSDRTGLSLSKHSGNRWIKDILSLGGVAMDGLTIMYTYIV